MTRECVIHHHACDCREARFKALENAAKSLRHATTKVVELEVTADGERIGIITFPASAVGRRYKMVRIDADLQEQAE